MEIRRNSTTAKADVCIIGMGYVGLTLATALAEKGLHVIGCEARPQVCSLLNSGKAHFYEKGIPDILQRYQGHTLRFVTDLPAELPPVVIICVGTPIYEATKEPDLRQIELAAKALASRVTADTLVIIRSTVPVGTSRQVILPLLRQGGVEPLLAFCPERTIQGKALEELRSLPQIVGGLTTASTRRARAFFEQLVPQVITISSLEAAEMIKLICNTHTDLIYGFGNEIALMSHALGLDACELIQAANLNYPRPDLSKPGFVGGGCLSKDPYLLMHSVQKHGYFPPMVAAARHLNEAVPQWVGQQLLATLQALGCNVAQAKILITGFAYKGQPETDDLRGAPVSLILDLLHQRAGHLVGHDFIVPARQIAAMGVEPVSLEAGFANADAVLVLNNHVRYKEQNIHDLAAKMNRPAALFDAWGMFHEHFDRPSDIAYLRLSHA